MKENHHVPSYSSIVRFEEHLSLRSLSARTREEYVRYVRKLAGHSGKDPSVLEEPEARAYLLYLKEHKKYAPSSMRIAVAALQMFFKDVPLAATGSYLPSCAVPTARSCRSCSAGRKCAGFWRRSMRRDSE